MLVNSFCMFCVERCGVLAVGSIMAGAQRESKLITKTTRYGLLLRIHNDKLGLSCTKLRIVELKIEDNKILGLKENWGEKHER